MLLKLIIGILAAISVTGAAWLFFDDLRFKQHASGKPWSAQAAVRISVLLVGPVACFFMACGLLKWAGAAAPIYSVAARVFGAGNVSLWLLLIGSASANRTSPGFTRDVLIERLGRLDEWSRRNLGKWWAIRLITGTVVGAIAPFGSAWLPALMMSLANPPLSSSFAPLPAFRAALGLEQRTPRIVLSE